MARVPNQQTDGNLSPPHFPDDVLIEIFLKLPARSLFLFRSVRKHWLHIIRSPTFIHLHLNRPINGHNDHNPLLIIHNITESHNRTKTLIHRSKRKKIVTLKSGAYREDVSFEALSPSMACRGSFVHLLGPCNGLFCITDGSDTMTFNPVTRQCRQVPHPLSGIVLRNGNRIFHRICFGFDSVCNEYKIVGFTEFDLRESGDEYSSDDSSDACYRLEISIFRFSTNSWTQLDNCVGTTSYKPWSFGYALFFNGAFHWLSYSNSKYSMAVFDLSKEALKQFILPGYFTAHNIREPGLSVLDEYMAIIAQSYIVIEIWVMKEYGVYDSWTKLYTIDAGVVLDSNSMLSFSKDGELLLSHHHGNLVSFNLNTRVIKELGLFKDPWYALRFRESLVSPGRSSK